MPLWSEILAELQKSQSPDGRPDFDRIRRQYLTQLFAHTQRNVILYASGWVQKPGAGRNLAISNEDVHGFMEVSNGLRGPNLDLILHSPGSPAVAEALVSYLRARFLHIRIIVPQFAMSAAAMIACAADEIAMGKHSFLGPTDPQLFLATPLGARSVSAQAILNQFRRAQDECQEPARMSIWMPMLPQYGPDLLDMCEKSIELSKELVKNWLEQFMFQYRPKNSAVAMAQDVAEWLSRRDDFKIHERYIPRSALEERNMSIMRLERDETMQDLSLSAFHAATLTFKSTRVAKIIENHEGRAFIFWDEG